MGFVLMWFDGVCQAKLLRVLSANSGLVNMPTRVPLNIDNNFPWSVLLSIVEMTPKLKWSHSPAAHGFTSKF